MKTPGIRERSYAFALRTIKLAKRLQRDQLGTVLWRQLLRSGTSVGANVEEAQAAQSKRDFVHKISIARKEAHENHYWLRLFRDGELAPKGTLDNLIGEADQLVRILSSIVKTAERSAKSSTKGSST